MKKLLLFLICTPFLVAAQQSPLMIEGTAGNLFVNHTAAPKESFYSIGRMYNISPKEIAPYNNTTLEKGLTIGQSIKIPLKDINFTQTSKVAADEVAVALYHRMEAKETLYQLSNRYGKTTIDALKSWNNLQGETVSLGQNMVVGYLKVKKELSALATRATTIEEVVMPTKTVNNDVANDTKQTKETKPKAAKIVKEVAVTPKVEVAKPVVVKEVVKEVAVAPKVEVAKPIVVKEAVKIKTEPVAVKEENDNDQVAVADDNGMVAKDYKGGVFKPLYNKEGVDDSGQAGVFKSLSGWQDGKYYCLYNKAQQHTIVKITNNSNGKFIYAKVLDVMPDLKKNNNLQILISNAAADLLGAGMNNFDCKIEY
jgi:LysM repeat protein